MNDCSIGSCPVVMNAANEVMVEKFLKDQIGFLEFQDKICEVVMKHNTLTGLSLEDIIQIDRETRESLK